MAFPLLRLFLHHQRSVVVHLPTRPAVKQASVFNPSSKCNPSIVVIVRNSWQQRICSKNGSVNCHQRSENWFPIQNLLCISVMNNVSMLVYPVHIPNSNNSSSKHSNHRPPWLWTHRFTVSTWWRTNRWIPLLHPVHQTIRMVRPMDDNGVYHWNDDRKLSAK